MENELEKKKKYVIKKAYINDRILAVNDRVNNIKITSGT